MTPIRVLALLSALALSACTITITPGGFVTAPVRNDPIGLIAEFDATREAFRIGERIEFRIRTNVPGFVTLTAQDPGSNVYVIARNLPVSGTATEVIPARTGRLGFVAAPPTGTHLVRAHFTPEATDERVVLTGTATLDGWSTRLLLELRGFDLGVEAIAQTRFDVVR